MVPAGGHQAAVWGAMIGAQLPDSDFVVRYWAGETGYLKHHRGATHGLVMLPLEAAVVAGALRLIWPAAPFGPVFFFTLLGCLSHVLSDSLNDYGTQALWPFSKRRTAMDLIPIIDLWYFGIIGAGWAADRGWPGHRQAVFAGVWVAMALYVAVRWWLHRRAVQAVAARFDFSLPLGDAVQGGPGWRHRDARLTVHPTILSLRAWHYIIQMPGEFQIGQVWVPEGRVGKPARATNTYDQTVLASLKSQIVALFAEWVRLPRVSVERKDGLICVRWTDMRYEKDEVYSPFTAVAWLDENLTLVNEGLGPQAPPTGDRELLRRRLRKELGREES